MGMVGEYIRVDDKMLSKLKKGKKDIFELSEELADSGAVTDLDKAWHIVHFVLSGKVWESGGEPLSRMVLGGAIVNEDSDGGYGPSTYLTVDEVREISAAAESVSEEWFRERYDKVKKNGKEVYILDSANESEYDELFEYAWSYFLEAKEFFKQAAQEKQNIVFSVV